MWVQNPKWLRTENGVWINRDMIKALSVIDLGYEQKPNFSIYIHVQDKDYKLIDGFLDQKAAQEHLDKLQLFYDLKPVAQPITEMSAQ